MRVDASLGDGWFYEGAGIYRHVWLTNMDPLHLGDFESTVRSDVHPGSATLTLVTIVESQGKQAENASVTWKIQDAAGNTVATAQAPPAGWRKGSSELHGNRHVSRIRRSGLWTNRISILPSSPSIQTAQSATASA